MAQGRFVVLEGLDGAGTTTQSARLVDRLSRRGTPCVATCEPTDGPVGRLLRSALRADLGAPDVRTLPWLFAADRADHLVRTVDPAVHAGTWVVSDRYVLSSLAYQSLTLPMERVLALNADFRVPDLVLFLDVPVDVCMKRLEGRAEREIYEVRDRLERISAGYQEAIARLRARGDAISILDGTADVDAVARAIATEVEALR